MKSEGVMDQEKILAEAHVIDLTYATIAITGFMLMVPTVEYVLLSYTATTDYVQKLVITIVNGVMVNLLLIRKAGEPTFRTQN